MQSQWIQVIIAALFEVSWVIGLKHADGFISWAGTLFSIILSFYLLIKASQKLPVGTVYAVFVGLGTAGTVLSEIILFGVPIQIEKILLITLLLAGVIGLKLVTNDESEQGVEH